jgi:hypothetical protein
MAVADKSPVLEIEPGFRHINSSGYFCDASLRQGLKQQSFQSRAVIEQVLARDSQVRLELFKLCKTLLKLLWRHPFEVL